MRYFIFLFVFVLTTGLFFGMTQLDLLINPWVVQAVEEWRWWNYLTSHHALTVMYLNGGWHYLLTTSFIISGTLAFFLDI